MSSEAIIGLYQRHALQWDADRRGKLIESAWLQRFLDALPEPAGSVLDIGCGGGDPIASWLGARGLAVTGVDASSTLIGLARGRSPDQTWIVGDMRELALGRRFAGLIAWDSFFHLTQDDQRAMFTRFAAHAAPGAPLMFTSGPHAGEAIGAYQGEPLYHASLSPEEYRERLEDTGFEVLDHRPEDPECHGRTVWLARKKG